MGVAWLGPSRLSVLHDAQSVAIATNSKVRAILSAAPKNTLVTSTQLRRLPYRTRPGYH
jgi:hypothetical protein